MTSLDQRLGPGETALWRGRPYPGLTVRRVDVFAAIIGAAWLGAMSFGFFHGVPLRGGGSVPPGSPFTAALIGLPLAIGAARLTRRRRLLRRTRYMVTDRRALIVVEGPRPIIAERDLATITRVTWESVGGGRGVIDFRRRALGAPIDPFPHGLFVGVDEPERIVALLLSAREDALSRPSATGAG